MEPRRCLLTSRLGSRPGLLANAAGYQLQRERRGDTHGTQGRSIGRGQRVLMLKRFTVAACSDATRGAGTVDNVQARTSADDQ
jgi:hypothetical protein